MIEGQPRERLGDFGASGDHRNFRGLEILGHERSSSALDAGVCSEGLMRQRLPAARIPASGPKVSVIGKFQGAMSPTTPNG